jgi:hypothetical protein
MQKKSGQPSRIGGVWWKPGESKRTSGTLTVSKSGGLNLKLILDDLDAPHPPPGTITTSGAPDRTPVTMLGKTTDGRRFTLWDGFIISDTALPLVLQRHRVGEKELRFNFGLEGINCEMPHELRFSKAIVHIGLLSAWLDRRNFDFEPMDPRSMDKASVSCRMPDPLAYKFANGRTLTFSWSMRGPAMRIFQTSATISVRPKLRIDFADCVPLETIHKDLALVIDLVQLLTGRRTFYRDLYVFSPSRQRRLGNGEIVQDELRWLASRMQMQRSERPTAPDSFLFPFAAVEERFNRMLQAWYELCQANDDVLGPFFVINRSKRSFSDERFFVTASTAEALHGLLYPGAVDLNAAEWKAVRPAIQKAIPPQYHKSLLPKLSHLPRLAFAERLRHLIDELTPSLRERVIGDTAQQEKFIKRVKTLRNAHAHRMKLKQHTVGFEFVRLANKLRVLIDWSLLTKIGLQKD